MKIVKTISGYCEAINVPPPLHPHFDIRSFQENMTYVSARQEAFRHELYAVALRLQGESEEISGLKLTQNLFFNSPYQLISWTITKDWKGWYIIFDQEFISQFFAGQHFLSDYPFFQMREAFALDLSAELVEEAVHCFRRIHKEYHTQQSGQFEFIALYTKLLLSITRRALHDTDPMIVQRLGASTRDWLLISRFQTEIERAFSAPDFNPDYRKTAHYANRLAVHPNHLNTVVKRATGTTASGFLKNHLVRVAKSALNQTDLSIKEIAYRLHFTELTHFTSYFKQATGDTPAQYRKRAMVWYSSFNL